MHNIRLCGISEFLEYSELNEKILKEPEVINYIPELFKKSRNKLRVYQTSNGNYLLYGKNKITGEEIHINWEIIQFLQQKTENVKTYQGYKPPYFMPSHC